MCASPGWDPSHATLLRLRACHLWWGPASRAGLRLKTVQRTRYAMVAGTCPSPLLFMASTFSICSPPLCVGSCVAGSEVSDAGGGTQSSSGHGWTGGTGESGPLLPCKRAQGEDADGELEQSDRTGGEKVDPERGDGGGDSSFPRVSVAPQPEAPHTPRTLAGEPLALPPWRQPWGKSQVTLPQMPPDSGGFSM